MFVRTVVHRRPEVRRYGSDRRLVLERCGEPYPTHENPYPSHLYLVCTRDGHPFNLVSVSLSKGPIFRLILADRLYILRRTTFSFSFPSP